MTKKDIFSKLEKIAIDDTCDDKEWYMKDVYNGCKTKQQKLLCAGRIRKILKYTPEDILKEEELLKELGNDNVYDELLLRDKQSKTPPVKGTSSR